jgi:hypothetical protein
MSNFTCEACGATCWDTAEGYITGCNHYPPEPRAVQRFLRIERRKIIEQLKLLHSVAAGIKFESAEDFLRAWVALEPEPE